MDSREIVDDIPIIKFNNFLIVTIQVDMHDKLAMDLQYRILDAISKYGSKGIFIDISVLDTVDSYIGHMLSSMASMAHVMDADVVIVGMQPAVAITLVELGLKMPGVQTALNMEEASRKINKKLGNPTAS